MLQVFCYLMFGVVELHPQVLFWSFLVIPNAPKPIHNDLKQEHEHQNKMFQIAFSYMGSGGFDKGAGGLLWLPGGRM